MSKKPLLQVALDYVDIDKAVQTLEKVKDEIDIVEVGTPLIKSEGMKNVLPTFSKITKKPIVADLKTADAADFEFETAAFYGASYVTALGASPIENIKDAVNSARELNINLVVDLIGVENYCKRAIELVKIGVEFIGVHCGISEQRCGKTVFTKTKEISKAILPLKGKIVVAGGINEYNVKNLFGIPNVSVIIIGGGITSSENPINSARNIQKTIKSKF